MKAREHLAISMFFIFVLAILIMFYDKEAKILSLFTNLFHGEVIFILGIGAGLFLLGAIFPDIDSEDDGSYIFHQPALKPLAKFVKGIFEIFGKLNHKGFLHTILGICLTSLVVVILVSIPYYWLISDNFSIFAPFFWFIILFVGQFFHLVEDWIKNPEWKLKMR